MVLPFHIRYRLIKRSAPGSGYGRSTYAVGIPARRWRQVVRRAREVLVARPAEVLAVGHCEDDRRSDADLVNVPCSLGMAAAALKAPRTQLRLADQADPPDLRPPGYLHIPPPLM